MHFPSLSFLITTFSATLSTVAAASTCTKAKRLDGAKLIISSYNDVTPGGSAMGFLALPLKQDCITEINANGASTPLVVGVDAVTTKNFALETRQVFSRVTGGYKDFSNGTSIIYTNVTLGLAHSFGVPVTFYAEVFLFYDLADCLMKKIQAFATIPTVIGGQQIMPPLFGKSPNPKDSVPCQDACTN